MLILVHVRLKRYIIYNNFLNFDVSWFKELTKANLESYKKFFRILHAFLTGHTKFKRFTTGNFVLKLPNFFTTDNNLQVTKLINVLKKFF